MSTLPMNHDAYGAPVMQDISRQRKLAEQLRAQSEENINGQMVSGHYVAPHWTQQLARLVNAGTGAYISNKADKSEKDYVKTKAQKLADFIKGNQAQTIQQGTTETSTMPAYEPSQMDRFGSPQQERQPVVTSTPNMVTESPDQVQQRQRAMAYQLAGEYGNTPEIQMAISDMNHQRDRGEVLGDRKDERDYQNNREEKLYNRNRADKLTDVEAEHKYQDIVMKEQQGFQLTMQDKQFVQQFKLQAQSQNFAAGQQSRSQAFQASENALNRNANTASDAKKFDQQLQLAGLKSGVGTQAQKANDAKDVLSILAQAEPLIKTATSSGLGNMVDKSQAFFGSSNKGANDAASLKALEGNLISKMPKMSGPQSDKDVLMYKQMAGQIGDPTIPVEQKQAAITAIKEINSRYAGVPYEQQSIIPKGEAMPTQDAGYLAWKKANGKQ